MIDLMIDLLWIFFVGCSGGLIGGYLSIGLRHNDWSAKERIKDILFDFHMMKKL